MNDIPVDNIEPTVDQEEESNDQKRQQIEKQTVYYTPYEQLDLVTVDDETETIDLSQSRLNTIENFSKFKNLKSICFRNNFLKTFLSDNFHKEKGLGSIIELDFYDNQIEKIENLNQFTTLQILDLSFNKFKKIENLDGLVNLKKLFLVHNRYTFFISQ